MIHHLKNLGLMMLAVLALGAMVSSAAGAASFTASKYPTSVTSTSAKGNDKLTTEGGSVECKTHQEGTLTAASSSITMITSYSECQAFGFLNATVIMGCDYVLQVSGVTDIECPASNKIVITAGTCEVQIGTQTGLSSVSLSNGVGDITAKANLSGIKYTVTKDGFGCPFASTGEKTGATYTQGSAVTVSSTNGATVDIEPTTEHGSGRYTASSYPTTITASSAVGNGTFVTEGGSVECASHFQGTIAASSPTLTVTPTYTGCKAFGFLGMTIVMNGCDYSFKSPTGSGDNWSAGIDIVCPAGKVIEITAGTCKITIGSQSTGGSAAITNNTAAGDMLIKPNLTGIGYTVTQDGFGCPFAGTGAKTGATFTQHSAITFDSTNGASVHAGT
jgi:hypothetical protein